MLERLKLDDVPKDVKNMYPTLAAFMPEILGRGVHTVTNLDLNAMHMEAVLREIRDYKLDQEEPFMFHHKANDLSSHLIHLPYTRKRG